MRPGSCGCVQTVQNSGMFDPSDGWRPASMVLRRMGLTVGHHRRPCRARNVYARYVDSRRRPDPGVPPPIHRSSVAISGRLAGADFGNRPGGWSFSVRLLTGGSTGGGISFRSDSGRRRCADLSAKREAAAGPAGRSPFRRCSRRTVEDGQAVVYRDCRRTPAAWPSEPAAPRRRVGRAGRAPGRRAEEAAGAPGPPRTPGPPGPRPPMSPAGTPPSPRTTGRRPAAPTFRGEFARSPPRGEPEKAPARRADQGLHGETRL